MLNHLLPVAEQASIYSDLKVIVTVGKSFYDTFNWLGFKKIIEDNHENHPANMDWPNKIDNDALKRNFSIWESINGKLYYNTWHIGGNKMPSKAWKHIEASLLSIVI